MLLHVDFKPFQESVWCHTAAGPLHIQRSGFTHSRKMLADRLSSTGLYVYTHLLCVYVYCHACFFFMSDVIGFHAQKLLPLLVAGHATMFRNLTIVSDCSANIMPRTRVTDFITELKQTLVMTLKVSIRHKCI